MTIDRMFEKRAFTLKAHGRVWIPAAILLAAISLLMLRARSLGTVLGFEALCVSVASGALYRIFAKRLKAAHANSRDHVMLRTMASASRQPFFFCNAVRDASGTLTNLRVRYANASACDVLNKSRRRLRGSSLLESVDGAAREAILREVDAAMRSDEGSKTRIRLRPLQGGHATFDFQLIPLAGGVALSALHSREELVANQRVDELNKFTQSVFETAPVSIIATDEAGTIVAMNNAAEQLTLYRGHELIGLHSILLLHDPMEISARAVELAEQSGQAVKAGFESLAAKPAGSLQDREWSYVRRDGSKVWVSVSMSRLHDEDGECTGYLAVAFDVTERKRLSDAAHHMAHHDQLTGLLNRSLLEQRLQHGMERAKRLKDSLAVFLIDIDHFKRINDSLGHSGGDAVLTTVAKRLLQTVRSSDTVVRIGGDEFVVILPHLQKQDNADDRAQSLLRAISEPFFIGSREVRVTATIGYALFRDDADTVSCLLRKADLAMYSAKAAGRGSFQAFSSELQRETADRLEMEEDLRHAIERGEFTPHYQPQVHCETGEVTGIEMLLRWHSPKRGNVTPDVFLPVAEQAGLMAQIGEWGVRRACFDCMMAQSALGRRLRVAVNLSPREFQNNALPRIVKEALTASHLPAADLELEITEQMLMSATPCLLDNLASIRNLGVSLAIDDFGTGFSNFSYILQYNVDRLKIDRSFINRAACDAGAAAVVASIIAMSHGLGMTICAEGVETSEQLDFLLHRECDEIQGFYFSRAVPLNQLLSVVASIHAMQAKVPKPVLMMPQTTPQRMLPAASCA